MKILITGGAGFIGSALIRHIINFTDHVVFNIDKLTYAGNEESLKNISLNNRYHFMKADICDKSVILDLFEDYQPDSIIHLAAESHVDKSISSPSQFIETNIIGTYNLLEASRAYLNKNNNTLNKASFRFHHVSTDEVFGDLEDSDELFTEKSLYKPNSPYSASKAASDHLVRAWHRTYNIPTIITNCSNNYGPYQFPEKLIPLIIKNALDNKPLPIYGKGDQVRDWLYVDDHAKAILKVLLSGKIGETYNIGGHNEKTNLEVVNAICFLLDELVPLEGKSYSENITFTEDRPGHDVRYAIDASKIKNELNWIPEESFETGLKKTVNWYLSNREWLKKQRKISNERYSFGRRFWISFEAYDKSYFKTIITNI